MTALVLKQNEVIELTGLSQSTLWRLGKKGKFPLAIRLGPNRVAWLRDEIEDWLLTRPRVKPGE